MMLGFEPLRMAKPVRNADPKSLRGIERTFFITSKTIEGRNLLQSERMALLFIDVLRCYVDRRKFVVHDFVVICPAMCTCSLLWTSQ